MNLKKKSMTAYGCWKNTTKMTTICNMFGQPIILFSVLLCRHIKESEKQSLKFRRSIFSKKKIKTGEKITKKNIIALRPKIGIDASYYFKILGKKVNLNIPKYKPIFKKYIV